MSDYKNKISDFIEKLEEIKEKYGDIPFYQRRWSDHWEKYVYDRYDVWDLEGAIMLHTEEQPLEEKALEEVPENKALIFQLD